MKPPQLPAIVATLVGFVVGSEASITTEHDLEYSNISRRDAAAYGGSSKEKPSAAEIRDLFGKCGFGHLLKDAPSTVALNFGSLSLTLEGQDKLSPRIPRIDKFWNVKRKDRVDSEDCDRFYDMIQLWKGHGNRKMYNDRFKSDILDCYQEKQCVKLEGYKPKSGYVKVGYDRDYCKVRSIPI